MEDFTALTKQQLQDRYISAAIELVALRENYATLQDAHLKLQLTYEQLILKNEDRLDAFIKQNEQLVASRNDLNRPAPNPALRPIQQTRKPWAKVAADFEAKKRHEYWQNRIKEMENRNNTAMNTVGIENDTNRR